jgi:hypothetical protein
MTSIQLIINQILYFIPKAVVVNTKEIFDNITDYIFYGGVINKTKKNKKRLISLINNRFLINKMITNDGNVVYIKSDDTYYTDIKDNNKNIMFNCRFCTKCGEYLCSFEMTYQVCRCQTPSVV